MKYCFLVVCFTICLGKWVNSQTIQELINLRSSITINQADKYLTAKGFKYERFWDNKEDTSTTVFFRREGGNPEFDAVATLTRKNNNDTFDIGYSVRSVNVFNRLKKECEELPDVEMAYEETTGNGYSRFFLFGARSLVFTISPNKSKIFFIYEIRVF